MPFRVKASAIAVSAAICTLLAPAAMAAAGVSHAPVQVTGKKLKSGLLPPTGFQPGYSTIFAGNSGGSLEHGAVFHIPSMETYAKPGYPAHVADFLRVLRRLTTYRIR